MKMTDCHFFNGKTCRFPYKGFNDKLQIPNPRSELCRNCISAGKLAVLIDILGVLELEKKGNGK